MAILGLDLGRALGFNFGNFGAKFGQGSWAAILVILAFFFALNWEGLWALGGLKSCRVVLKFAGTRLGLGSVNLSFLGWCLSLGPGHS